MAPLACATLDGNADAVEFCPTPPFCHILAAATYTLHEGSPPSRAGSLSLFSLESQGQQLRLLQRFDTPGIFDLKWKACEAGGVPFLAHANADGSLTLYTVHNFFRLTELRKESICSAMCLSLDWDPHSNKQISLSRSDGKLSVVDVGESQLQVCQSCTAHDFEAWSVTYDSCRSNLIYSGGDDCHFCGWDLRQGFAQSVFREKKTHQMGVCCVQTNAQWENIVATGSYDENLRLWDARMLEKPVLERALGLGGGVWRLKWNPHDKGLLIAACMHNGFVVVKVQDDRLSINTEYKEHKSLAYGADWFKAPGTGALSSCTNLAQRQCGCQQVADLYGSGLITDNEKAMASSPTVVNQVAGDEESKLNYVLATCSFYDRSLHIWEPHIR